MSQPNKDNRPEAVLDRVLEKTGVMSQPKSNEDLIEGVKKTIYPADEDYERGMKIGFNDGLYKAQGIFEKALAQKDNEVAEAVKQISATFDDFASAEDTDIDYCRGAKFGLQLSLQYLNTPKSKDY